MASFSIYPLISIFLLLWSIIKFGDLVKGRFNKVLVAGVLTIILAIVVYLNITRLFYVVYSFNFIAIPTTALSLTYLLGSLIKRQNRHWLKIVGIFLFSAILSFGLFLVFFLYSMAINPMCASL